MNYHCPNSSCLFYQKPTCVIKDGSFYRRSDSRRIQRFRCRHCGKRFSSETHKLECYQKKRRINYTLMQLLCSGVSMRRAALILRVNKKSVERRLPYLGEKARLKHQKFLQRRENSKTRVLVFDDLITKENSKLKPLSVSVAVDEQTREILSAKVSQIPAFGHLSRLAVKKYGWRECQHRNGLKNLFEEIKNTVDAKALIKSDQHKKYPEFVARYFPRAEYETYKSERAHVAGQGELKKGGHDPIYVINHSCAMMRANINRLIRKTWCTTKSPVRLQDHLDLFLYYFNQHYLPSRLTPI